MRYLVIALLVLGSTAHPSSTEAAERDRFKVEIEVGPAWQNSNNVQIPNSDLGTRFSLEDLVGSGPWPAGRLMFTWKISQRSALRMLLAPFSYTESGTFDEEVLFASETYQAGIPTEATYQFNSWRMSYLYKIKDGDHWNFWIGITAKIRDAKIALSQQEVASQDTDVGFVPLLYLAADWRFATKWHVLADLDGLAGGPGRAIDGALKLGYDINDRWSVTAGYRVLEGGADVDAVYNFAWFNYAVVSGVFRF